MHTSALSNHGKAERFIALFLQELDGCHNNCFPNPKVIDVPIRGVISDGQRSIRKAVQAVLPGVPHQLCHFHYLREAAKPVYEADKHAKKELALALDGTL